MRRCTERDEELRAVGVLSRVRHAQLPAFRVLDSEGFVGKLLAVNALAARSVAICKVSSLAHEARNDSVERAAFVMQGLASLADTLVAGAQRSEVLHRFWTHAAEQVHLHATSRLAPDADIEEDFV